jgi:hypothetical protein
MILRLLLVFVPIAVGLRFRKFNAISAGVTAGLMMLASVALIIPSLFKMTSLSAEEAGRRFRATGPLNFIHVDDSID